MLAAGLLVAAAGAAAVSCSDSTTGPAIDPNGVAYSFVVVGCNRLAAPETLGVVSTANVQQLNRDFADIAAMSPKPNFLFFAGDMVFGYTNDSTALDRELKGWIALYQASPLASSGVELVTVPGNHETDNLAKVAVPAAERVWLRDMAAVHQPRRQRTGSRWGRRASDGSEQVVLLLRFQGCSFRHPQHRSGRQGLARAHGVGWQRPCRGTRAWRETHLRHRPQAGVPVSDGRDRRTVIRPPGARCLLDSARQQPGRSHALGAQSRVLARAADREDLAGHRGQRRHADRRGADLTVPSTGTYFGFTVVTVTNSGRVFVKGYGRDVPAAGYATASTAPVTLRDSVEITWK